MNSDDLVGDFLNKGGEVQKVRAAKRKAGKRRIVRGKFQAAKAFKAGGRLS